MSAAKPRRLSLEDLDTVLARAKAERWTELTLLGPGYFDQAQQRRVRRGWMAARVFVLRDKLKAVPPALLEIESLSSLALAFNEIGDAGAEALARLTGLSSLALWNNQIGDAGAEALARLTGLTSLELDGSQIGDAGAEALARLTGLSSLALGRNQIGAAGAEALARLTGLTSLDLRGNQIGDVGTEALARLDTLTSLGLGDNEIGDAGAEALSRLSGLTSLDLGGNQIGDTGAEALSRLSGLTSLSLWRNEISDAGAEALSRLSGLTSLHLRNNQIGDAGAEALARLGGLTSLSLAENHIADAGGRALLDAWADPATSDRRRQLDLRGNYDLQGLLPAEVLKQDDAQVIIEAWRRQQRDEAGEQPLPEPEAVGAPSPTGLRVKVRDDGLLTSDDAPLAEGARDDEIGRELHAEVIEALDRLIVEAGRSNTVAVWREAAEGAKERLGSVPTEVRVSALLRIERLRGLREADERRRLEPDPLVEPAEAGVAAALGDAVNAANLYVQTDPYLAEQQQRLADPGMKLELTVEAAEAAEADLEELEVAEPELLDELRRGRETAEAGGVAGERARVWLAGSWRNVFREAMRQVLASVRTAAMDAKVGAVITIADGEAALQALGLDAKLKLAEGSRQALASLGRIWLSAEPELGKGVAQAVKWGSVLLVARHLDLLPRLGWSQELVAALRRLLGM